jgi:hypothetical protein
MQFFSASWFTWCLGVLVVSIWVPGIVAAELARSHIGNQYQNDTEMRVGK